MFERGPSSSFRHLVRDARPEGAPRGIITKINVEIINALKHLDLRKSLVSQGAEVMGNRLKSFTALIKRKGAMWTKMINESGTRIV